MNLRQEVRHPIAFPAAGIPKPLHGRTCQPFSHPQRSAKESAAAIPACPGKTAGIFAGGAGNPKHIQDNWNNRWRGAIPALRLTQETARLRCFPGWRSGDSPRTHFFSSLPSHLSPQNPPLDLHLQAYGFLHIRPKRQISRNHHHFAVRNDSNRILLPKLCPQRENNGTAFRSVSIVLFYAPVVKIFRGSLWDVFVNEHWPTGPRLKKASYKLLMDQNGLGRLARKRITFLLQNRKINCKSNFCMIDYLRFCAAGGGRGAERCVSTKPACPMGADGPGDQMRNLLCSKINHQEPPAGNGCGG